MPIDFSQFHPLDHTLGECRGYPGGRRRHIAYAWEWRWREAMIVWFKHVLGIHTWFGLVQLNQPDPPYFVRCRGCNARPDDMTAARVIGNMKNSRDFQLGVQALKGMTEVFNEEGDIE